jgi:hypothetical protein
VLFTRIHVNGRQQVRAAISLPTSSALPQTARRSSVLKVIRFAGLTAISRAHRGAPGTASNFCREALAMASLPKPPVLLRRSRDPSEPDQNGREDFRGFSARARACACTAE